MEETGFSWWLTVKFLEYQTAQKRRVTVGEFAKYIGVHQVTLGRWMNGARTPEHDYIPLLVDKFGDETYDALELLRPDPRLQSIIAGWRCITDEQRDQLARDVERFLKDNNW